MAELFATLPPEMTFVAVAVLVALSLGGVLYALFQPQLSGDRHRQERLKGVTERGILLTEKRKERDGERRRRSVQEQLREFEDRQKNKQRAANRPNLDQRLAQAGLDWSKRKFIVISILSGLISLMVGYLAASSPWVVGAFAFVGTFGLPRWFIARCRNKRLNAFLDELPNAVDVVVRGTKAGLPLGECITIVANEAREPVKSEFRRIVETQTMGVSLADAVAKLPDRVPVPEANFFAIVIAIQQQAGGSLSEALGNLSKVLRGRKTMKGKIRAMSAEAKSSAAIIGSLPVLVTAAIYMLSPDYIMLLFTETAGNVILISGALWMIIGVMVMRKMINFDI